MNLDWIEVTPEFVIWFWIAAEIVAYLWWPIVTIIGLVLLWKIWRGVKQ